MKRTTVRLQDVAELAGVSLASASRVLNANSPTYRGRGDLRERVLAAAAELGYEPNLHARALASATSNTIGLVVHDVSDAYFGLLSSSVVRAADKHDLLVTMVCTYRDPASELKYVKLLRAQRPRAIIMAASGYTQKAQYGPIMDELSKFEAAGGVVVSLAGGRGVGHRMVVGNKEGARSLAHALVELGHRTFAIAVGPTALVTVRDRVDGFRQGLADHGIEVAKDNLYPGDTSREAGMRVAEAIKSSPDRPTCVFGVFDVVAAGVVAGLQRLGVDVPGEVSVAGFADVPLAAQITPALTTVSIPLDLVGQQAVDLALTESAVPRTVSYQGNVIMRQSTAPPPA
ncbi:LacI family DNA-binding transcriptional regulator [Occultella glacieicola]|uniref:LacI family DNA-binding transcriptional regulator n=1 Tax=Occultella glacieicola TaxID=2518684 RepID=UPI00140554CE|nr:LacI family DNA-binding transcriptional regulator [Occultella glacieicola]